MKKTGFRLVSGNAKELVIIRFLFIIQVIRCMTDGLNNRPFYDQTVWDHSNTKLVWYSVPPTVLSGG